MMERGRERDALSSHRVALRVSRERWKEARSAARLDARFGERCRVGGSRSWVAWACSVAPGASMVHNGGLEVEPRGSERRYHVHNVGPEARGVVGRGSRLRQDGWCARVEVRWVRLGARRLSREGPWRPRQDPGVIPTAGRVATPDSSVITGASPYDLTRSRGMSKAGTANGAAAKCQSPAAACFWSIKKN